MSDITQFSKNFPLFLESIKRVIGEKQFAERQANAAQFYLSGGKSLYRDSDDLLFTYIINCMSTLENERYFYNPLEYSRIYPVILNLVNKWKFHTKITNFNRKLRTLCNTRENNIDAVLFEILTAFKYCELGYSVEFIKETNVTSPDILISKNNKSEYIECKKLQRANDYSYNELDCWYKISNLLLEQIKNMGLKGHFHFKFRIEIEKINAHTIVNAVMKKLKRRNVLKPIRICNTKICKLTYNPINKDKFNTPLDPLPHKDGTSLLNYLTGKYNYRYIYKLLCSPIFEEFYPYISEIQWATVFSCQLASHVSLNNRVQSIKKHLAKASSQLSSTHPGNIHILIEEGQNAALFEKKCITNREIVENFFDRNGGVKHVFVHIAKHILPVNKQYDVEETIQNFSRDGLKPVIMTSIWYPVDEMRPGYGTMLYEY
ncbi:hypothetical protein KM92DES2_10140 [uncultured Desulfovibrio sp.]|uniref:Uncharacterized protein n=1 Tax=uncultured Desulfovibrio sp. TaxID=167968 RepID=A0A212IWE6_9BACT|nr:hypothetical protein [uncultured Desulfovibrio sp.]SBV91490.1 hypothetical protein KM92DES2_10140 [uncultured Desulfovibrio sp.]